VTADWPGSLAAVARLCRDEAARDRRWASLLGDGAREAGPGERQQFLVAASHRHTALAAGWEARLPVTDDTARMLVDDPPEPVGDLMSYRAAMAARSEKLSLRRSEIDPICDPATDGLIAEAIHLLSRLIDEAAQVGV
jgi:hypothetical protein